MRIWDSNARMNLIGLGGTHPLQSPCQQDPSFRQTPVDSQIQYCPYSSAGNSGSASFFFIPNFYLPPPFVHISFAFDF
jgi:hypothetical protein